MRQKIIAGAVALTLTSFAAIGAFASQDGVSFKSLLSGGVLGSESAPADTATSTTTASNTDTATATTTGTPGAAGTPSTTDTVTATTTVTAAGTPAGEDDQERDIKGIPTSNSEHPEATGTCEKGEAAVKTTPAGTQVNVPCQAIGDHGEGHGDGNSGGHDDREGSSTGTPTVVPTDTVTPTATATP